MGEVKGRGTKQDPRVIDREAWLIELRRTNEEQESALDLDLDPYWGEIEDTHRAFIERFCSMLPSDGRVLDAACGPGRYFSLVLESGRSLLGVDHTDAYLSNAASEFPEVPTEKHDLQDLPYRNEFDGVMCVDAMEFVPPEDWPVVLEAFHDALRPGGALYLTIELQSEDEVRSANERAMMSGLPVVDGEVIWGEPEGYYHYYPAMDRVHAWIAETGFEIFDEMEGLWHEEGYAYHHVLARVLGSIPRHGSGPTPGR